MPDLDISAEVDVVAAPADVAAVMFDPQQEPQWIEGVTSVELLDPALTPGARVKRSGSFMGRPFAFQTEVETVHFPHVLAMKIAEGPFIGTIRYDIQRSATGSLVRIRGVGDAPGLPVPSFMITGPARRALAANLERLKTIVEKT